jgi:hypothetical protein
VAALEPEAELRWNNDAAVDHAWEPLVVDMQDNVDPNVQKHCVRRMRTDMPLDLRWHVEEDSDSKNVHVDPKIPTVLDMDVHTDWEVAAEGADHLERSSNFLCVQPRMVPTNRTDREVAASWEDHSYRDYLLADTHRIAVVAEVVEEDALDCIRHWDDSSLVLLRQH